VKTFLRFFFRLLYHQFAFTYDLVAAAVSFNRWKDWVMSVLPFIEGNRILEIGHGPGHLQRILLSRNLFTVGIDESPQMGRLAQRNWRRALSSKHASQHLAYTQPNLSRGVAQQLPFCNDAFDTVVATFPTEYINDPNTLAEVKRCLSDHGKLITLPAAIPRNPFLDWLFRVTHQSPSEAVEIVDTKFREPFVRAGFKTEVKILDVQSGTLLIVVATK
jgi:ubiquinone/menaquinone biosynthesis C-methylase UbiE